MTAKQHRRKVLLILLSVLLILVTAAYFAVEPIERNFYPIQYRDAVEEYAASCNLPPSLVYAVIHTESRFQPDAISSAEAKGLMQITDDTYRWACRRAGEQASTPDDLYEPDTNIRVGCYVLFLLYEQFSETETVLAAYNAGQGRVRGWLSDPAYSKDGKTLYNIPYEETANYVSRVLKTQQRYQQLYNIP